MEYSSQFCFTISSFPTVWESELSDSKIIADLINNCIDIFWRPTRQKDGLVLDRKNPEIIQGFPPWQTLERNTQKVNRSMLLEITIYDFSSLFIDIKVVKSETRYWKCSKKKLIIQTLVAFMNASIKITTKIFCWKIDCMNKKTHVAFMAWIFYWFYAYNSLLKPPFLQITLKQDGNGKNVFQSNLQDKGLIFACVEIWTVTKVRKNNGVLFTKASFYLIFPLYFPSKMMRNIGFILVIVWFWTQNTLLNNV